MSATFSDAPEVERHEFDGIIDFVPDLCLRAWGWGVEALYLDPRVDAMLNSLEE